ncbi:MAG TPA: cupin domain-containing protein [Gaiellaceae bacterium]|nr:cupin domain-containing protein [Gaiellaceae bacterium]
MEHWNLNEIETPEGSRSPVVVHSREGERRVVLLGLEAGQSLDEHQVKESALVLVLDGEVRVEAADESVDGRPGTLVRFGPDERHSVTADADARLLLLLAPWPGDGHYRGDRGVSASSEASSP